MQNTQTQNFTNEIISNRDSFYKYTKTTSTSMKKYTNTQIHKSEAGIASTNTERQQYATWQNMKNIGKEIKYKRHHCK